MSKLTERQTKALEAFPSGWFGREVAKMSSRELRSLVAKGALEYQPSANGFLGMPKYRVVVDQQKREQLIQRLDAAHALLDQNPPTEDRFKLMHQLRVIENELAKMDQQASKKSHPGTAMCDDPCCLTCRSAEREDK